MAQSLLDALAMAQQSLNVVLNELSFHASLLLPGIFTLRLSSSPPYHELACLSHRIRLAISPYLRVVSSVCLLETTNGIPSRSLTSLSHTHTETPHADRSNDLLPVSPAVGAGMRTEEAHTQAGPGDKDLTTPTMLLTTRRERGESSGDGAERGGLTSIRLIPFNARSPGAEVMI